MSLELDAFIVRHIKDFNIAAKRMEFEIAALVAQAINGIAADWAMRQRWDGVFEWHGGSDTLWFAPREWKVPGSEDDAYYLWFQLDAAAVDDFKVGMEYDYNWLVRLTGVGTGRLGFHCRVDTSQFGKSNWKRFVAGRLDWILAGGFAFQEKSGDFFLPVKVDHIELADAIADDDVEAAMEPVRAALALVKELRPEFDRLLKAAKKEFDKA